MNCRITQKPMTELFSLGKLYISDFIKTEGDYRGIDKQDLTIMLSPETQSLQLKENADKHLMYGKYWYHSGTNDTMTKELKDIAESATNLSRIKSNLNSIPDFPAKIFLDIASNDGTLLSFVSNKEFFKIGIDPAEGVFQEKSRNYCHSIQGFFSKDIYKKLFLKEPYKNFYIGDTYKASIITCIAMFYDLENPKLFLDDVYEVLQDDGLFIIQQSYMPLMIKQLAFDNICHEHVFYHSLYSMEYLLKNSNFKIVDVQLNDVNGGSFRIYAQKEKAKVSSFGSSPYRDVCNMRIQALREYEKTLNLDKKETYNKFWENIQELKNQTFNFIESIKKEGKSIWVYGASTKGNTLLQWFGLNNKYIDGAAERSPFKYGLKTMGTDIPIHSDETMRQVHPDYLLILPWHFINEFKERELEYLKKGGKFIVPCPKFEIIGEE